MQGVKDATLLATLVRDLITPEQHDVLIGPWHQVIGEAS